MFELAPAGVHGWYRTNPFLHFMQFPLMSYRLIWGSLLEQNATLQRTE
jgi:hypothetical protein